MGRLVVEVPGWVDRVVATFSEPLDADEGRMGLAVALSRESVEQGGGPFGAVVFAGAKLLAAGVNLVLQSGFSIAHAEIVALMQAQAQHAIAGAPAADGVGPYALYASTEPCCQCFGALVWAGVERLVCGATTADAEAVGFDEGPKPDAWVRVLEARGITVARELRRPLARAVLTDYVRRGSTIYGMRAPNR